MRFDQIFTDFLQIWHLQLIYIHYITLHYITLNAILVSFRGRTFALFLNPTVGNETPDNCLRGLARGID